MPAGAFTAARHLSIDDDWFAANPNGSIDFKQLRGSQDFRPQAVYVNTSTDATQRANGYAVIRGYLYGENEQFVDDYYIDIRKPVGLAFRTVYSNGTTARGIKFLTEQ